MVDLVNEKELNDQRVRRQNQKHIGLELARILHQPVSDKALL